MFNYNALAILKPFFLVAFETDVTGCDWKKLNVKDIAGLIKLAYQCGVVRPD